MMATNGFDLPSVLDIVTTLAVVFGVFFGLMQLRQATRHRRDHAAVDIVRAVQTPEIRRAVAIVLKLPENADPEAIRTNPVLLDAALAVDSACEMWGCMVYEGVVELHMLDRMVGGWIRKTWVRLGPWVVAERAANPNAGEWWQWLYERMEADPDPGKALGAHISYRGTSKGQ